MIKDNNNSYDTIPTRELPDILDDISLEYSLKVCSQLSDKEKLKVVPLIELNDFLLRIAKTQYQRAEEAEVLAGRIILLGLTFILLLLLFK
jgi:hypothetical protein